MTQDTKQTMLFQEIFGKKVQVDFNGAQNSSDAGLLFLREIAQKIGIIERIVQVMHDRRNQSYVQHDLIHLISQRVFQIAAGYADANDSNTLRFDPILKIACETLPESDQPLASQPTISRFENAVSWRDLYKIAQVFLDIFVESYEKPPHGIILDLDDTEDPTHGSQQLTLFNGYFGGYCYQPIHIYEGHSGRLITTILRPGKRPSGKEIVSILKRVVAKIRTAWPKVGIIVRGDSHYNAPEVHDFCQEQDLQFVLGMTSYPPMVEKVKVLTDIVRQEFETTQKPVKRFTEFTYQAGTWANSLRIIAKVEHTEKDINTRFIVTNLKNTKRRMIYDDIYGARGKMELMIKEHKNHLASDRTSCSSFKANQFRVFLHSIAYVLMHAFREKHLKNTPLAKAQFDSIRLKLIKIGASVRQLVTKIKIQLPKSYPMQADFYLIWNSCCAAGYP